MELIGTLAAIVQSVAVVFVIWQVVLLRRQLAADHERSRRLQAIEDVKGWASRLGREAPVARKVVESFSAEQCNLLVAREPFYIAGRHRKALEIALGLDIQVEKSGESDKRILLSEEHLAQLLFLCIGHLNSLETALLGWQQGVSDSVVIEQQFRYVVSFDKGHFILEKLRETEKMKGNYPAIGSFVAHLRSSRDLLQARPRGRVA